MTRLESLPISITRRINAAGEDARHTVVWLHGEHDLSTSGSVAAVIARVSEIDKADVVVDLSEVAFMDGSIVNALIRSQNELSARGLFLFIRAPSAPALHTLRLCGATSLVMAVARIHPTGSAAALSTWVDVPAQPTAKREQPEERVTQLAPAARERATAVKANRDGG